MPKNSRLKKNLKHTAKCRRMRRKEKSLFIPKFIQTQLDYMTNITTMMEILKTLNTVGMKRAKSRISSKNVLNKKQTINSQEKCLKIIEDLKNATENQKAENIQAGCSKLFDYFTLRDRNSCSARAIFSEIMKAKSNNKFNIDHLTEKTIRHVFYAMNSLDLQVFKKILLEHANRIPGNVPELVKNSKLLVYYLVTLIKYRQEVIPNILEILHLWYMIQPLVFELIKYTNEQLTPADEALVVNTLALYDRILEYKKNDTN